MKQVRQQRKCALGITTLYGRMKFINQFRDYLSGREPTGCPVTLDHPPGHTYEFLFTYRGEIFYGKILLFKDRQRVLVLSAHLADFEKLSCE